MFERQHNRVQILELHPSEGLIDDTLWDGFNAEQISDEYFTTTHKHFPIGKIQDLFIAVIF